MTFSFRRPSPRVLGVGAALVTVLMWTAFIVVARASAHRSLTPFDIAFMRFVGAGVAMARTESTSSVNHQITALGGRVGGNLSLSARGDESVDADAVAGTGGVVAGAGAEATVSHQQDVSTVVGTAAAGLLVTGTTTLSADRRVRYDSQTETVNASAFGGSGAVTRASLTGSAMARLDDDAHEVAIPGQGRTARAGLRAPPPA